MLPTGKDYLWGGTRLREEYGKKIDLTPLAETWECSVHPDGPSYIANGEFKGLELAEVLKRHPEYIGTKVEDGKLPVLVKFIDAKKDLSVQVHPSDAYARDHEGDNGKTEMWYVIDAEEGAHLIYGFQHEVTEEILRKAVETGTLDKHLQKVEVHKGDTYFVPAGTVHGIGKGILVAEIQESSNVTYRVYDYNRVDKNGKKRELHFDKAVQVMDMSVAPDVSQKPRIHCISMLRTILFIRNTLMKMIFILGRVESMAAYYESADVIIEPVFDGGGMKVKTIEALSFGKVIVSTSESLNGYWEAVPEALRGKKIFRCNTADEWIVACNSILDSEIRRYNSDVFNVFVEAFSEDVLQKRFSHSLRNLCKD